MKKIISFFLLSFGLAFLLNLLLFERSVLFEGRYAPMVLDKSDESFKATTTDSLAELTKDEQNAIHVERENLKILAEYEGKEYVQPVDETLVERDGTMFRKVQETVIDVELSENKYIKKLMLTLPVQQSSGFTLSLYDEAHTLLEDGMYCSINPKIGAGVMNVEHEAKHLTIVLLTSEAPDLSKLNLTISNDFSFYYVRIIFFMVAIISIGLLIIGGKKLLNKPEKVFVILAFLFGGIIILAVGTNQVGYDEYAHARNAYRLSFGSTIETSEAAMQMVGNTLPFFNNPEERELVEAYEDFMNDSENIAPDVGHQSIFPRTENRVYYPMAIGFFAGRTLGVSFADMVALAKLGNLLCYIGIVYFAIKFAKGYGVLVAAIGLLPNNLFIAAGISYDALVTSCLLLAYVLAINEMMTPKEKMKPLTTFVMLVAFVIGCLSKPVYIVMAFILLFLPKEKFNSKWMQIVFKIAVFILGCLMIYNIFFPTPVAGGDYQLVSNASYSGDKRNVGTSTMGQIEYILKNPMTYTKVLLSEMFAMFFGYTFGKLPFIGYAYLGAASFIINWILILTALFAAIFAKVKYKLSTLLQAMSYLMIFGVTAIVFSSMYISYTAVGSDKILGVQGRYFIPLFLPFLAPLLGQFSNAKLDTLREKLHGQNEIYSRIILGVLILINLSMTYRLMILPLNV